MRAFCILIGLISQVIRTLKRTALCKDWPNYKLEFSFDFRSPKICGSVRGQLIKYAPLRHSAILAVLTLKFNCNSLCQIGLAELKNMNYFLIHLKERPVRPLIIVTSCRKWPALPQPQRLIAIFHHLCVA